MVQLIACEGCGHGVYSDEKLCPECHTPIRPEWVARQKHDVDVESDRPDAVDTPAPPPAWPAIWPRVVIALLSLIAIAAFTGGVLLVR